MVDNDSERRRSLRLPLWVPTRIDTATQPNRFGMTRNVSSTGALLGTPTRFRIGERADIELRLPNQEPKNVPGRIVRLEVNESDEVGLWRYLMAVRFLEPLSEDVLIAATDDVPTAP